MNRKPECTGPRVALNIFAALEHVMDNPAILGCVKLVSPAALPAKAEFPIAHGMAITGILEFAAGTRLPITGVSTHEQDEVSFIIAGRLEAVSGGQAVTLNAGDISFIPAGEAHWALVLEDTRIAYVLIPRAS